jgi:hypothetical protein
VLFVGNGMANGVLLSGFSFSSSYTSPHQKVEGYPEGEVVARQYGDPTEYALAVAGHSKTCV